MRPGVKWTHYPPDVLAAWVADMDLPPAEPIAEELRGYLDGGDWGYVNPLVHHRRVTEALSAWVADRHGWQPVTDQLRVVGDVMQGVAACLAALTEPGDGIIIQTPVYHPFGIAIESAGRRIVEAPLSDRESGYRVTAESLESAVAQGARMILLSNPHNPMWPGALLRGTGTHLTPGDRARSRGRVGRDPRRSRLRAPSSHPLGRARS